MVKNMLLFNTVFGINKIALEGVACYIHKVQGFDICNFNLKHCEKLEDKNKIFKINVSLKNEFYKKYISKVIEGSHLIIKGRYSTSNYKNKLGLWVEKAFIDCTDIILIKDFVGLMKIEENEVPF